MQGRRAGGKQEDLEEEIMEGMVAGRGEAASEMASVDCVVKEVILQGNVRKRVGALHVERRVT